MTSSSSSGGSIGKKVPVAPMLVIGSMAGLFALVRLIGAVRGRGSGFKSHYHEALTHDHPHVHVTHNRTDPEKGVGGWEHLTAEHSHSHNHAAMEHSHRPHRDFDAEHRNEAHVHDHEHPARS